MKKESRTLLKKIIDCKTLEGARAYAEAIEVIEAEMVSIKLSPKFGENYSIINVIKEVRSLFGMGLKEAKDAVEQGYTWSNIVQDDANTMVAKLKSVGAKAEVVV